MPVEHQSVGILGGGQIGALSRWAARKFGCRIFTLSEKPDCSAKYAHGPENLIVSKDGDWLNEVALAELSQKGVEAVSPEWENVPINLLSRLEELGIVVRPGIEFFEQMSNRKLEKQLIDKLGGTPVPWREIQLVNQEHIGQAAGEIGGFPCILKSISGGYDGKDQWSINAIGDILSLPTGIQGKSGFILEKRIEIAYECSVGVGRHVDGNLCIFPPALNEHENRILRSTLYPGPFQEDEKREIMDAARQMMSNIGDYVGLIVIEMFRGRDGKLYINEFAPRPHNSLHATLGHDVSQFDVWLATLTNQTVPDPAPTHVTYLTNVLNEEELFRARNKVGKWEFDDTYGQIDPETGLFDYRKTGSIDPGSPRSLRERKQGHIAETDRAIFDLHRAVKSGQLPVSEVMKRLRQRFTKRTGIELTVPIKN